MRATLSWRNDLHRRRGASFVSLALVRWSVLSWYSERQRGIHTAIIRRTAGGFVGAAVGDAGSEGHINAVVTDVCRSVGVTGQKTAAPTFDMKVPRFLLTVNVTCYWSMPINAGKAPAGTPTATSTDIFLMGQTMVNRCVSTLRAAVHVQSSQARAIMGFLLISYASRLSYTDSASSVSPHPNAVMPKTRREEHRRSNFPSLLAFRVYGTTSLVR